MPDKSVDRAMVWDGLLNKPRRVGKKKKAGRVSTPSPPKEIGSDTQIHLPCSNSRASYPRVQAPDVSLSNQTLIFCSTTAEVI